MKKVLVLSLLTIISALYFSCQAGTWTSGNTTVRTSGSTITVSAKSGTDGAMADKTSTFDPAWVSSDMTQIVIEEGVTHIGAYAFIEAKNVTRVDIPTSVTSIGEGAFSSCSKITKIYYAGSPNQWASIDFANSASNPFWDASLASYHDFYFHGCDFTTRTLTLEPGITTINNYAFANATIQHLNIPGTVEHIGAYAFSCSVSSTVCVNRTTPPSAGTNAITYGGSANLYVPTSAVSAYNTTGKPWKNATRTYGPGATGQAVSGTLSADYGSGVTWALGQDGILTLDASSPSASKSITLGAGGSYPWGNFRRLVHKIKLRGEIEALGNALAYHWFLTGIILDQNTVPTCSKNIGSSSITSTGSTAYNSIFNPCHPLTIEVPLSTILDDTWSANLSSDPWTDGHWQVALDGKVIVDENEDNTELLTAVQDKVTAPFTMEFKRSLTNASYNTFCSPIPMSAEVVESTFGAGTQIHELSNTSVDGDDLVLEFADSQDYIEAGVPYIIQPASAVVNPIFTEVDPSEVVSAGGEVNTAHLSFRGVLTPRTVTSAEIASKSFIFLQSANTLTWADRGTMKAMRAYWLLTGDVPARALARNPRMLIRHNTPTDFESVQTSVVRNQKVLWDGKLYIMHNGQMYDVQGRRVQ